MSEPFDPYYKWLAIRPKDQPPNHYRLLGVELFEDDSDVIANSADQRMAHVKSYQSSEHVALSQKLLNEIATAQACLLNANQKQQYDIALGRDGDEDAEPDDIEDAAPLILMDDEDPGDSSAPPRSSSRASTARNQQRESKINLIGHIIAPIVGLLLAAIVLWFIRSGDDDSGSTIGGPNTEEVVKKSETSDPKKSQRGPRRRKPPRGKSAKHHEQPSPISVNPEGTGGVVDPPDEFDPFSPIDPPPKVGPKQPRQPEPTPPTPEEQLAKLESEQTQAIEKGDAAAAVELAIQIGEVKSEDVLALQAAAIVAIHGRAKSSEDYQQLAKSAIAVAQRAVDAKRKKEATEVATIGLTASRRTGDTNLTRQATLVWIKANELQ